TPARRWQVSAGLTWRELWRCHYAATAGSLTRLHQGFIFYLFDARNLLDEGGDLRGFIRSGSAASDGHDSVADGKIDWWSGSIHRDLRQHGLSQAELQLAVYIAGVG